jgi:putative nucleotidyltransferase with HDIG domain
MIDRIIERIGDLPAMPGIVSEVLSLIDDPHTEMSEISAVIQRDPPLTAKILRISNSPYYGMKQYVGTLKLALVILGAREIRNIVLGISVMDTLADEKTDTRIVSDVWGHSFLVGALAKRLGENMRLRLQSEAFIGGLLHDIGKLALARQLGEEYKRIYRKGMAAALCDMEREVLGFTHADATAVLAQRWNFPETLADALRLHHEDAAHPLHTAKDPHLAAIVRIANLASRDDFKTPSAEDLRCVNADEAWQVLNDAPTVLAPETRVVLLREMVDELQESAPPAF